jgi:hypothetical protein
MINLITMYPMRWIFFILITFSACSSSDETEEIVGEYIFRTSDEKRVDSLELKRIAPPGYPWQQYGKGALPIISKEYFRCKGSALNPVKITKEGDKEMARFSDCSGGEKHSLPLRNDKEFVYPILIELLSRIQEITKKPVVITSGHRCPDHNSYVDPSPKNSASKHMLGAEVDFYIKGMESRPEVVIKIIQDFYKKDARYQKMAEFQEFHRFERSTNVSIQPWFNKEIFIKIFKAQEGRNFDNRHGYPYINIQVRFDRERNLPLTFSWHEAQQYLRR